jgi:maltose alpha-D-glucosyltransferase/alpha-amylase
MPKWLDDAVFYEIYPQSFYDANGDGIGDFEGIIQKLDYISDVGCNAIWLNPCFDSPFKDAGYDVRDYKKTAPRYGTNEDLRRLFSEAHKRNIHVLLDLVPGHTSEEHTWFLESRKDMPNEYWNRYIWTDNWFTWGADGMRFIAGEAPRNASYIINFFKCQPALNYGFLNPRNFGSNPPITRMRSPHGKLSRILCVSGWMPALMVSVWIWRILWLSLMMTGRAVLPQCGRIYAPC